MCPGQLQCIGLQRRGLAGSCPGNPSLKKEAAWILKHTTASWPRRGAVKPPQPGTFVQSKAGQHFRPRSPEVLLCFDVEWDVSPTDHSRGQRGPPALAFHQISPCQVTAPHSHQAHTVLSLSASHQYRTNHTCMAVLKILKQQLWKYSTSGEGLKSPGLSQKP